MEPPPPLPRMSSGERPIGAAKGKQSDTEALCQTPPPSPTALHTRCTASYLTSHYGTPPPPSPQHWRPDVLHGTALTFMERPPQQHCTWVYYMVLHQLLWNIHSQHPHSTAHWVYYTVPHQALRNTPSSTALHTGYTTR